MTDAQPLRIGTRASPLALAQAHEVQGLLGPTSIVEIKTTGDKVLDRPLKEIGGKGLFSKEIDEALLAGRIDLAVHSLKDLETWLPEGTCLAAILEREDPRDVFVSPKADSLDALPSGSVIGTSSLRRQAQILHRRNDLSVEVFRGNVQTRMKKLGDGVVDATLLALAGLNRLGLADVATEILDTDVLLPAVAQGAIGIMCRADDETTLASLTALDHRLSRYRISAERAMLEALDGSCQTPIGGLAEIDDDGRLTLRGLVARADGSDVLTGSRSGSVTDAVELGRDLGDELRQRAGPDFF